MRPSTVVCVFAFVVCVCVCAPFAKGMETKEQLVAEQLKNNQHHHHHLRGLRLQLKCNAPHIMFRFFMLRVATSKQEKPTNTIETAKFQNKFYKCLSLVTGNH